MERTEPQCAARSGAAAAAACRHHGEMLQPADGSTPILLPRELLSSREGLIIGRDKELCHVEIRDSGRVAASCSPAREWRDDPGRRPQLVAGNRSGGRRPDTVRPPAGRSRTDARHRRAFLSDRGHGCFAEVDRRVEGRAKNRGETLAGRCPLASTAVRSTSFSGDRFQRSTTVSPVYCGEIARDDLRGRAAGTGAGRGGQRCASVQRPVGDGGHAATAPTSTAHHGWRRRWRWGARPTAVLSRDHTGGGRRRGGDATMGRAGQPGQFPDRAFRVPGRRRGRVDFDRIDRPHPHDHRSDQRPGLFLPSARAVSAGRRRFPPHFARGHAGGGPGLYPFRQWGVHHVHAGAGERGFPIRCVPPSTSMIRTAPPSRPGGWWSLTPDLEVGGDGALSPRTVMNPLSELTIATHGRGGLRVGSVTVRAPGSIGGVLRFDIPNLRGRRGRRQPDGSGCPAPGAPPGPAG